MTAGTGPLVVVGDLLLDREILGTVDRLCPEAPVPVLVEQSTVDRPGGAGLAAHFAVGDEGDVPQPWPEVVLVAAVSRDAAGQRLLELLTAAGIRVVELPLLGPTPEKIRLRAGAHLLLRLDRGDGRSEIGPVPDEALDAIHSAGALLVSDYGRGVLAQPRVYGALADRAPHTALVWDPHPRGGAPVAGAALVTPNRAEAAHFSDAAPALGVRTNSTPRNADPLVAAAAGQATRLRQGWSAAAVSVTLGERGAVVCDGRGVPTVVPSPFTAHGDPCGAGDRFASAAAAALAAGSSTVEAVRAAVAAATAYVSAGGALGLLAGAQTPGPITERVTR
ncbi:MAG TPA: PfkB family carbohydrate kinase [Micromonosporaceae bacterium]|nr:PfkB family carbohydrate kinase [Micromonosporaceae bacterium]